jgi:hypothetical protein
MSDGDGEFGHTAMLGSVCGAPCFVDSWGDGPFVIEAAGRVYRFEDSDRFGPYLVNKSGDVRKNPYPPDRSDFWRAHRIWVRQGRRTASDGQLCIWDEPRPTLIQHIGGRNWMIVENGDEDGKTIKLRTALNQSGTREVGK